MDAVLTIPAVADRPDEQWLCTSTGDGPWAGLFAWGDTFAAARQGLAQAVWAQITGTTLSGERPAKVRILCITRKTFGADALDAGES